MLTPSNFAQTIAACFHELLLTRDNREIPGFLESVTAYLVTASNVADEDQDQNLALACAYGAKAVLKAQKAVKEDLRLLTEVSNA